MIDISIAIVAYHNETDVRNAVCSIEEHTAVTISKQIYIIDNSIQPNSLADLSQEFSDVIYMRTGENLGFGGGHNYVLPDLESKFHAIVNPDILLKEDTFSILFEFMKDETIGMAVPRMVDEQGMRQDAYRRELTVADMGIRMFLPGCFRKRQQYHTMQEMDYTKAFEVPFAQGSFLFIRTELFCRLGGFDPRYFMYMEDADLCRRVRQEKRLVYCPDTTVIHRWEKGSHKDMKLLLCHVISMMKYFHKWGWKLW